MNPFEKEFWDSLQLHADMNGAVAHRFTDTASMRFIKGYSLNQPGDFMYLNNGRAFLFECKSVKNKTSFECRYLKEHQLESMIRWEDAGGIAYLLLNERSTPRSYKAYALRTHEYLNLCACTDRKSLSWDMVSGEGITLDRVYPKQWDISGLMH